MGKKPIKRTPRKTAKKKSVQFSQSLFDQMMIEVMEGKTIREICSGLSRPSIDGFYGWVSRMPERAEQYTRAREISSDGFEADILSLARQTDPDTATANKARFEMLRWVMARRAPKRYGDKQTLEHTGEGGGPVQEIRRVIVDPKHGDPSP